MNSISRIVLLLFLYGGFTSVCAQEKKYKQALDSLSHYMNYRSEEGIVQLLTFYSPGMQNGMSESYDSSNYHGMTDNNKTKIVVAVGSTLYMLNLALMDTLFIKSRLRYIQVKDLNKSRCIYHSAEARIFNGKYGGVPIEEIRIPMINYSNGKQVDVSVQVYYANKIDFFLKQAILSSKKVKVRKKDLINREE